MRRSICSTAKADFSPLPTRRFGVSRIFSTSTTNASDRGCSRGWQQSHALIGMTLRPRSQECWVEAYQMQVTLVAHYGGKPVALSALVQHLQGKLHELLGPAFLAYELEQVHGTVIGFEG